MADISERSSNVTPTVPTQTVVPAPAAPDAGADEPYRPLSLMAIFGFTMAVVYAALVLLGGLAPLAARYPKLFVGLAVLAPLAGVLVAIRRKKRSAAQIATYAGWSLGGLATVFGLGGLVAFSGSNPWLLLEGSGWILVLAAVLLCWLARSRIASSEGTLGGTALATWGLAVGLFFGLNYAAYLASNVFAIRGQARQCAEEFLKLIPNEADPDALVQAYSRTLSASSRPKSELRSAIEIQHNIPRDARGSNAAGMFSTFCQQPFVLLMRMGQPTIKFDRIERTIFKRGGYEVDLVYKIDTVMGSFEMQIGTTGQEVTDATGTRRQWHVDVMRTLMVGTRTNTPAGDKFEKASYFARQSANEWVMKLRANQSVAAFLDTIPHKDRTGVVGNALLLEPALVSVTGLTLPGAWGAKEDGGAVRKLWEAFRDGALVDQKDLWAARDNAKKEMAEDIRMALAGKAKIGSDISLFDTLVPAYKEGGEQSEFRFPIRFLTWTPEATKARYFVEGEVIVVGPAEPDPAVGLPYRVTKLRLVRGQTAPDPTQMQR
jgi:hypothetical protein